MTDLVQRLYDESRDNPDSLEWQAANRIEQLEAEVLEQCRINGMGAERELALMAKVERLERELAEANKPPTGTAPCARFCEHTAFVIEARQSKATIQQLEREIAELRNSTLEEAAVVSWNHYMDTCKQRKIPAAQHDRFIAATAIRSLKS